MLNRYLIHQALKKIIILIVALAALGLAGCPLPIGDEMPGGGNSAFDLTGEDFDVMPTRTLSPSQLVERLNAEPSFTWFGNDPAQAASANVCIQYMLSRIAFRHDSLSVRDLELKDCFPQTSGGWYLESYKASFYMHDVYTVDGNGSYNNDFDGLDYFYITTLNKIYYYFRSYTSAIYRNSSTDETQGYVRIRAIHGLSGLDSACGFEDILNYCQIEEVFTHTSSELADDNYTDKAVIDVNDLGIVYNAPYFKNGSMTFTFNNWSGAMTYNSNENTPPDYSSSNGAELVTGTYAPPQTFGYLWGGGGALISAAR